MAHAARRDGCGCEGVVADHNPVALDDVGSARAADLIGQRSIAQPVGEDRMRADEARPVMVRREQHWRADRAGQVDAVTAPRWTG